MLFEYVDFVFRDKWMDDVEFDTNIEALSAESYNGSVEAFYEHARFYVETEMLRGATFEQVKHNSRQQVINNHHSLGFYDC